MHMAPMQPPCDPCPTSALACLPLAAQERRAAVEWVPTSALLRLVASPSLRSLRRSRPYSATLEVHTGAEVSDAPASQRRGRNTSGATRRSGRVSDATMACKAGAEDVRAALLRKHATATSEYSTCICDKLCTCGVLQHMYGVCASEYTTACQQPCHM